MTESSTTTIPASYENIVKDDLLKVDKQAHKIVKTVCSILAFEESVFTATHRALISDSLTANMVLAAQRGTLKV